jgi:hypothetical protein
LRKWDGLKVVIPVISLLITASILQSGWQYVNGLHNPCRNQDYSITHKGNPLRFVSNIVGCIPPAADDPLATLGLPEASCNYQVPIKPSYVPQTPACNSVTCWAATIAMMLSWRDKSSYTMEDAMSMLDPKYADFVAKNMQLGINEYRELLRSAGLTPIPGTTTASGIESMLKSNGPILLVYPPDPKYPGKTHAVVIIGMQSNDGTCSIASEIVMYDPLRGAYNPEYIGNDPFISSHMTIYELATLVSASQYSMIAQFK